ncbi:MAG: L-threonylcarbamoyladenylate synthase [Actinomycetota bacterium]
MSIRPGPIERAANSLRGGDVVGLPTDTVYGLAADPGQSAAVAKLFGLKGRDAAKPIGILVADLESAFKIVRLPEYAGRWAEQHWPGPLNLVGYSLLPLVEGIGDHQRGTVGVRVPDHRAALQLLRVVGPLAVTSANRTGGEETVSDREARRVFGDEVAYYLAGRCQMGEASTTIDVSGSQPVVLRRGPLDLGLV